jgi:hypothetical protein
MKRLLIIFAFMLGALGANSQTTIKQDAAGNYVAVKDTNAVTSAKPTGKTYTDTKGNVYPVMISKNGKLFVIRISKTGNKYNQYLKL